MGNTVNPDGGRIRALRIQRGWTQEQLAEIAGVSPRTIQRAESADRASFDTVRAVAGAFGMEFEEVLKAHASERPAQSIESPAFAAESSLAFEGPPPPPAGTWRPLWLAVPALSLGVLIGGVLMRHPGAGPAPGKSAAATESEARPPQPERIERLNSPGSQTVVMPSTNHRAELKASQAAADNTGARAQARRVDNTRNQAPSPPVFLPVIAQDAAATLIREKDGSREDLIKLESRKSGPLLLNLPTGTQAESVEITSSAPVGSSEGPGAVRQAMGQAGRKTGEFFSKFGSSMRKAF